MVLLTVVASVYGGPTGDSVRAEASEVAPTVGASSDTMNTRYCASLHLSCLNSAFLASPNARSLVFSRFFESTGCWSFQAVSTDRDRSEGLDRYESK